MNFHGKDIKIFTGSSNVDVAQGIAGCLGLPLGKSDCTQFSDGEISVSLHESVRGSDCFIVQSTCAPVNDNLMEMLIMIDAMKRASAARITVVMPYFGYARQDRKAKARDPISAKLCADIITCAGADRVLTMDLHAAQVQGFFTKPVDHLYAQPLLAAYARHAGIVTPDKMDDIVVVSPDAGSAKRARAMADELGCAVAIGDKMRVGHDENAKVLEIIGDVKGKDCIVVDDFTISGGTLIDVAHGLKDKGANKIYAFLSHVVLQEKGVKRIDESPIELLVSTDTVDCPAVANSKKIRIISAAPLFAEAVRAIHDRVSVSNLFEYTPRRMLDTSFARQMSLKDMR